MQQAITAGQPPPDEDTGPDTDQVSVAKALAALHHWWREPIAGLLAMGVGTFDAWHFGRDAGLSTSLDEILIIGGVVLVAGSRRLFTGAGADSGKPSS